MPELVAIAYEDETAADRAVEEVGRCAEELLIDPDATAVIVCERDGDCLLTISRRADTATSRPTCPGTGRPPGGRYHPVGMRTASGVAESLALQPCRTSNRQDRGDEPRDSGAIPGAEFNRMKARTQA